MPAQCTTNPVEFEGWDHPGARASRPQPYSCKQPAVQGHSFARRAEPTIAGISLPWCRGLCGRDARAPGWVLFLQTASHPRPLPCKAHQTRLYGVLFHVTHYVPEMCLIANIAVEIVSHPEGSSPT